MNRNELYEIVEVKCTPHAPKWRGNFLFGILTLFQLIFTPKEI